MITSKEWASLLAAKYPDLNRAELSRLVGVSKATITHWFSQKHSISESAAVRIAELLNVPALAVISTSLYEKTENPTLKSLYYATQEALMHAESPSARKD